MACQIIQKKQEEKKIKEEQVANARYWKIPACCDDDDDYNSAITPNEPVDSLNIGDEHLDTIPATKSDEFIKSYVENLVPNPSESEGENGCDVPACFTNFSNILFDSNYESDSGDYQSSSDEDFPKEIFLNPSRFILLALNVSFFVCVYIREGAEVAAQDVPHPMPAPDQPPAHLSTPSRQQTSNPIAPVLEHGQSSDPYTASFSRSHETDAGPFTTIEDAPMGGDFHTSPSRSSQAPPAGQPSGGAEDPITLTALSFVVSTLVHKVHSLETELHDHKKLFKDVVGKLVKKVKVLEVKLKTKKRKMVVSDFDQEDVGQQDVDLDALRALANATMAVDSNIPFGGTSQIPAASPRVSTVGPPSTSDVPLGTFNVPTGASTIPAGSLNVSTDVFSSAASAGISSKGKSPMVKEDIPVKVRTFKQMEEDRLGEEASRRLHDEEIAHLERKKAEVQRKRQQDFIDSAMYYNEADWLNIRAQVEANASLAKTLLGDDVSEDNFPARMAAFIKRKRQALTEQLAKKRQNRLMTQAQQKAYMRHYVKNQSSAIYNTGWTMAYVKSFTDDQLKHEFDKIRKVQSNSQPQAFSRSLKRTGSVLEEPSSKRQKSPEA
nr:JmjC domain-containing protein [Tanacetum cinerariifolium]